jgi:2-polyprenyl-3-methyl-5-hydroxy-6-metoxy-1,4-benzoquinol methylase
MRESKQKKLTKRFFNQAAGEWFERTYDPSGTLLKYPVNGVRKDIAVAEMRRLRKRGTVLDLGCGTGHMVTELLGMGYNAAGIDVAENMIAEAKRVFQKAKLSGSPDDFFSVGDCLNVTGDKRYDMVTSLGLLEYLKGEQSLFSNLKRVVKPGGYALVECRNQLFNLFSGNRYTTMEAKGGSLRRLIGELAEVERYSPVKNGSIPGIYGEAVREMDRFLSTVAGDKKWFTKQKKRYSSFPKSMVRQQHTPEAIARVGKRFGFNLEYVVYYHMHPFIPAYEKEFPRIYNKLAFLLSPIGYTSLGAVHGSAFIGVFKKKR